MLPRCFRDIFSPDLVCFGRQNERACSIEGNRLPLELLIGNKTFPDLIIDEMVLSVAKQLLSELAQNSVFFAKQILHYLASLVAMCNKSGNEEVGGLNFKYFFAIFV